MDPLLGHFHCRCTPLCDACHKRATGIRSREEYSLHDFLRYEAEMVETDEEEDDGLAAETDEDEESEEDDDEQPDETDEDEESEDDDMEDVD